MLESETCVRMCVCVCVCVLPGPGVVVFDACLLSCDIGAVVDVKLLRVSTSCGTCRSLYAYAETAADHALPRLSFEFERILWTLEGSEFFLSKSFDVY